MTASGERLAERHRAGLALVSLTVHYSLDRVDVPGERLHGRAHWYAHGQDAQRLFSPPWIGRAGRGGGDRTRCAGWLGFGYMHYQCLVVARETALQHLEGANLDLQDMLKQLRDEIQMNRDEAAIERDWLRARVSELEQKLSLLQRENVRRPKAAVTLLEQRCQVAAVDSSASDMRNFVPPGWVPDYISATRAGHSLGIGSRQVETSDEASVVLRRRE